ncbi:MAG: hypothetical protein JW809_01535 [Pirellulales bacterium]|nr:hypothetical protein [Pirellulales bacterium]
MSLTIRRATACVLIVLLGIISGVGEGLHWIPGCGHGVPVGDTIVLLGIEAPDAPRPADDHPRVERPRGEDIPIFGEDQCAICSAVGQTYSSFDVVPWSPAAQPVGDLPSVAVWFLPTPSLGRFQARAPPVV